ncbi:hypothetical protein NGRA_2353 [Nosema granulosis]|uniref:Uncharacterized protein n=1 Tax=Nosema granulosis TaxID=83296 RepID=A0A9P6GZI5_9MICR|nr:hypothetical protein NGRA_2353 [Nosema granulosis]
MFSIKDSSLSLRNGNNRNQNEAAFCFLQDGNGFIGETTKCPHYMETAKTVDHLVTKCDRMLSFDYTRRHNEVVRCIHQACLSYNLKSSKIIKKHSVQEVISNDKIEIRVNTRIKIDFKI